MGTKNVLKWNRALGFEFSVQSSVYGATTVAKISLFYTWTWCTVSFKSMLTCLVLNKHWQFSTQTNFLYLGRVNVCMITGTCCS